MSIHKGSRKISHCRRFLRENMAWWLTPIILIVLLVAILIVINTTASVPFVYTI